MRNLRFRSGLVRTSISIGLAVVGAYLPVPRPLRVCGPHSMRPHTLVAATDSGRPLRPSADGISVAELPAGEVEEQAPVKELVAPIDSPATEQEQGAAEAEATPAEAPPDVAPPPADAPADVEQPAVEP